MVLGNSEGMGVSNTKMFKGKHATKLEFTEG